MVLTFIVLLDKLVPLVAESQENDSASSVDWSDYVYGIETIYDKVKSILEDARCLSRRQHNTADDILSRTSPKISDVSSLLDSLGVSLLMKSLIVEKPCFICH